MNSPLPSLFYLKHDYAEAAKRYQKALDLEKQNRTFNKSLFRVLVDNLGMSYGLVGKLSKAKETFEYGVTQDAEYPLFHYLLGSAPTAKWGRWMRAWTNCV
jgi:tetratricopeptide (TPR) repeat protein